MQNCQSKTVSPNNRRYRVTDGWHEELCNIFPNDSDINDCRSYFSRLNDCVKRETVSTTPFYTQPSARAAKKTVPDDIRRADIRADIRARNHAHNQPRSCNWHNKIVGDGYDRLDPRQAGRLECAKRVRQKLSLDDNDIEGVFPTLGDDDAEECHADAIRWGTKFRDEMKMCRHDLWNAKYGPGGTSTNTRKEKAPGDTVGSGERKRRYSECQWYKNMDQLDKTLYIRNSLNEGNRCLPRKSYRGAALLVHPDKISDESAVCKKGGMDLFQFFNGRQCDKGADLTDLAYGKEISWYGRVQ